MAAISELLLSVLSTIREPRYGNRVHKDECVLSFSSPESPGGLYVCMRSFLGLGRQHVERHHARTGQRAYLHIVRVRKTPKEEAGASEQLKKKQPTRLAIGMEGGFEVETPPCVLYEQRVTLVLFPDRQEVTSEELGAMPEAVREAVRSSWDGILAADSASHGLQVAQWDGEERRASRHADGLKQLEPAPAVGPWPWRCQAEGCGLTENLWMNLTDGAVLCGRSQFGSAHGNNHAKLHYEDTGHPLAVKLGTVTPDGADVYSYEEEDMVLDPRLRDHLAHFGLDMTAMEKTERTITDLEIAVNQREWELLQESSSSLRPLHGPGLTGMKNLGNSCYLNAVMQVLFSVPDFQSRYVLNREQILDEAPADPTQDFNAQVSKLGYGLLSGEYSKPAPPPPGGDKPGGVAVAEPSGDQVGIAPRMFKALVGRGHPEFSTNQQQDAQEFLMHFMDLVERNHRGSGPDPARAFRFLVEERVVCQRSQKARYTRRVDYSLQLPVPMERASNLAELQEAERRRQEAAAGSAAPSSPPPPPRARIPFAACLDALTEPELLSDFWSSALRRRSSATRSTRFASFPDLLLIQVKKFTFGAADQKPRKLDVSIDVPDTLDLRHLRGTGRRDGEELLPEEEEEEAGPALDPALLARLQEMQFPEEACRKALFHTDGGGLDAAVNWLMDHCNDHDFSAPLVAAGGRAGGGGGGERGGVSQEHLDQIMDMKLCSREHAVRALRASADDPQRAVDWIFNHPDSMDPPDTRDLPESPRDHPDSSRDPPESPRDPPDSSRDPPAPERDGVGRYELFAFISHMGSSTLCGHYVCHIKKDQQWVIFNDQKVCASERPPTDLGYLYFYRRMTSDP